MDQNRILNNISNMTAPAKMLDTHFRRTVQSQLLSELA